MMICSKCNKNVKECKCIPDWFKEKVKSKAKFYKRYRIMPHLLEHEDIEIYKEWIAFAIKNNIIPHFTDERFEPYEYECWLFDYYFGDLIE